jgi:hypothetical protein
MKPNDMRHCLNSETLELNRHWIAGHWR